MSERILVVGAGATGGFFGARLAQHGRDVTFLVRPPRAAALRRDGLRVTGLGGTDVIAVQTVTAADLSGVYDVVLLSVKATGLSQALDDLAPAVGPDTVIVPFLNGLAHMEVLNGRFGPQRVLGAAVRVISASTPTARSSSWPRWPASPSALRVGLRRPGPRTWPACCPVPGSTCRPPAASWPRCGTSGCSSPRSAR